MTRFARLMAVLLTAALLLSSSGCIANLHEQTDGFTRKPVLVGLGMPIAAAVDLALLPISIPTNLIYFLKRNPSTSRHAPDYHSLPSTPQAYTSYDYSGGSDHGPDCGCCRY